MAEEQHIHGACPLDCPDTCSWIVTVKDGRAVKLRGDRAYPFTRGALCNKLNNYEEDRETSLALDCLNLPESDQSHIAFANWPMAT